MHISLDEFNQTAQPAQPAILGAEKYTEEMNESLGTAKAGSSEPNWVKMIKAEARRARDISPKSLVVPIKGDGPSEAYSDIVGTNKKGTPSFIYLNTNGRATYIHVDAYGALNANTPVAWFSNVVDEQGAEGPVEAKFDLDRGRPKFKDGRFHQVLGRLDYSRGYAGIVVLADPDRS